MHLRETRQKRADGSVITHLQLAESVWNPERGRAETRILYNCGRAEDPAITERPRRLAKSITTIAQVKADLQGWQLSRCLFVGDAGMVSEANLQTLGRGGGKCIVGVPMRRGDAVTADVLSRPGRYRDVAEHLRVEEVVIGDGERRRRYVVCHNALEAQRQQRHRAALLAELASLEEASAGRAASGGD